MNFFSKFLWLWVAIVSALLGVYFIKDIVNPPAIPRYTYLKNYNLWNDISLSEQDILHFYSHGFLIIRDAIPVSIIDDLYDKRPLHSLSWFLWPFEYIFSATAKIDFLIDSMWVDLDFYRDFWYFSPLVKQAIAPMFAFKNTFDVRLLTDIIFAVQLQPFIVGVYHQDSTSYGMLNEDSQTVSVWIPLMDVNGAVDGGSLYLVNKSSTLMPDYCQSFGTEFIRDLHVQKSCMKLFDDHTQNHMSNDLIFMSEYFNKGDILLFDKFTFHKTQPLKKVGKKRFAYVGRFADGNSLLNDTISGAAQQKKNACKHGLKSGDMIHTACYPQLFPHRLMKETQMRMNNEVFFPPNDVYWMLTVYRALKLTLSGVDPVHIY